MGEWVCVCVGGGGGVGGTPCSVSSQLKVCYPSSPLNILNLSTPVHSS